MQSSVGIGTMHLKKIIPGSDIAAVSFPNIPPEKNVRRYLESKAQDEKIWHFPDWDLCRPEPSMDLVRARRKFVISDNRLAVKRKEYFEQREKLDIEWDNLAQKERTLRRSFILFHKFVKENKEKKERSRRRIAEEQKIHARRNSEIEMFLDKIEKMTTVKYKLEESVSQLKMYEDYLAEVVAISPEYRSIQSVLNRYDALSTARNDLVARQKEGLEELEKERIAMMELIEERVGVLMGLNNELAHLQGRYQRVKGQARYWENVVFRVKTKSAKEMLQIYMIKDSIWNLYKMMCMRKGVPFEIDKNDVEELLTYIKGTITEYKRIVKIASKKTQNDIGSTTSSTDTNDQ